MLAWDDHLVMMFKFKELQIQLHLKRYLWLMNRFSVIVKVTLILRFSGCSNASFWYERWWQLFSNFYNWRSFKYKGRSFSCVYAHNPTCKVNGRASSWLFLRIVLDASAILLQPDFYLWNDEHWLCTYCFKLQSSPSKSLKYDPYLYSGEQVLQKVEEVGSSVKVSTNYRYL